LQRTDTLRRQFGREGIPAPDERGPFVREHGNLPFCIERKFCDRILFVEWRKRNFDLKEILLTCNAIPVRPSG